MKYLFWLFITLPFLSACSESFKTLDEKTFNAKIAERSDINSPEELIKLYYNYPEVEQKISIQVKDLPDNRFETTLIHEGIEDDSQFGEKIIMLAERKGKTWNVIEIKQNWKCWDSRGDGNWGIVPCN
jgi:hypothetical protein